MTTRTIRITKKGTNSYEVSNPSLQALRGSQVKFEAKNADVQVWFVDPPDPDWFNPPIPDSVKIDRGNSQTYDVHDTKKKFPTGETRVTIKYLVTDAASSARVGADPDIIIEEC